MAMTRFIPRLATLGLALGLALGAGPAAADSVATREIVDKAKYTVEKLRQDPDFPDLNAVLGRAKGVLVVPSLLKAGFIFGGEGGSGVLLSKNAQGQWSHPAFYTLGSGSFGLQIGVQDAEVIFAIMTDKGLDQVIKSQFKLGADASIAVGPVGVGLSAGSTLNVDIDIYSFAKTRGLYGGASFDGTVIYKRDDWNREFYGQPATAREIVWDRKFTNPAAEGLRQALAR